MASGPLKLPSSGTRSAREHGAGEGHCCHLRVLVPRGAAGVRVIAVTIRLWSNGAGPVGPAPSSSAGVSLGPHGSPDAQHLGLGIPSSGPGRCRPRGMGRVRKGANRPAPREPGPGQVLELLRHPPTPGPQPCPLSRPQSPPLPPPHASSDFQAQGWKHTASPLCHGHPTGAGPSRSVQVSEAVTPRLSLLSGGSADRARATLTLIGGIEPSRR